MADFSPLSFSIHTEYLQLQGYVPQPHESMEISRAIVGPNYFHTMKTSLISGRDFTDGDAPESQRVAIVNQALADRYWPGEDAIGKQASDGDQRFTIVGVAGNAKYRLLTFAPEPVIYLPMYQAYRSTQDTTIHVRVSGSPRAMAFPVEQAVHELNPELPLFNMNPLTATMKFGTIFEHVAATFAGSFGLLAMLLAAVGIYGVVAYTTRQRTREIGIRMALGAEKVQIYKLVLGQGLRLTLAGLVVGMALSLAVTRLLNSKLYAVGSTDAQRFRNGCWLGWELSRFRAALMRFWPRDGWAGNSHSFSRVNNRSAGPFRGVHWQEDRDADSRGESKFGRDSAENLRATCRRGLPHCRVQQR